MNSEFYDKHLRSFPVHKDTLRTDAPFFGSMPGLFRAYEETTGCQIQFVRISNDSPEVDSADSFEGASTPCKAAQPVNSVDCVKVPIEDETGIALAYLETRLCRSGMSEAEKKSAIHLVQAMAKTLAEIYYWNTATRENEAELAIASLDGLAREDLERNSAVHALRNLLRDGCNIVGCIAASIYLLDQDTSSLKLRVCWGLPEDRLTEPARPLKNARADLEALLGNAVILNEHYLTEQWQSPETFSSSICVPITSENTILGTVWFYSDDKRTFGNRDLSVMELVSGRIAIELEKAFLQKECHHYRTLQATNNHS